jgi:hypothetical protein
MANAIETIGMYRYSTNGFAGGAATSKTPETAKNTVYVAFFASVNINKNRESVILSYMTLNPPGNSGDTIPNSQTTASGRSYGPIPYSKNSPTFQFPRAERHTAQEATAHTRHRFTFFSPGSPFEIDHSVRRDASQEKNGEKYGRPNTGHRRQKTEQRTAGIRKSGNQGNVGFTILARHTHGG